MPVFNDQSDIKLQLLEFWEWNVVPFLSDVGVGMVSGVSCDP